MIGTALSSKAAGHGHRRIASALDRSPSTVRRWMRRATRSTHLQWLWRLFNFKGAVVISLS